jgi:HK97 family phage prohead protease
VLDGPTLQKVKAIAWEAGMEHMVKAATVTATDLGEFTAIAAAWTVDRQREQIRRGAFADTIARWKASGKRIPVHWDHKGEASNVIGAIDPATMMETAEGLYVEGRLDLDDSDTAREAWRSMKDNRVALSFGYLVLDSTKRRDGIKELRQLDLFEISIVPAPANPDTRFLSLKSMDDQELERVRTESRDLMMKLLTAPDSGGDRLRAKSKAIEREFAPVKVESFEC